MAHKKPYIIFALFFLAPVILAGLAYVPYQILLFQSGEQTSPEIIAQKLASDDECIYARATLVGAEAEDFKPLQYEYTKPDVVVIGSSRSMQFKDQYFTKPAFTFGGAVHNIYDFRDVIDHALGIHKPEAMILQMDYWWFNPKYLRGIKKKKVNLYRRFRDHLFRAYRPYIWMTEGKLTWGDFIQTMTGRHKEQHCRLGLMGSLQQRGYTKDGSYFYGTKYLEENEEKGFFKEIEAIDNETFRGGGDIHAIDEGRVQIFAETLQRLEEENIKYAVVFPPFAPDIYDHLRQKQPAFFGFMNNVVKRVKTISTHVYDFHNPRTIRTTNCEFLDGDHGGQTSYARILNAIRWSPLKPFLDTKAIKADIRDLAGKTISPDTLAQFMPGQREIDFLQMGCAK